MARLLMDTTLGDPGYGQRSSLEAPMQTNEPAIESWARDERWRLGGCRRQLGRAILYPSVAFVCDGQTSSVDCWMIATSIEHRFQWWRRTNAVHRSGFKRTARCARHNQTTAR